MSASVMGWIDRLFGPRHDARGGEGPVRPPHDADHGHENRGFAPWSPRVERCEHIATFQVSFLFLWSTTQPRDLAKRAGCSEMARRAVRRSRRGFDPDGKARPLSAHDARRTCPDPTELCALSRGAASLHHRGRGASGPAQAAKATAPRRAGTATRKQRKIVGMLYRPTAWPGPPTGRCRSHGDLWSD